MNSSSLNPEAAPFVPVSPTRLGGFTEEMQPVSSRLLDDEIVAESPRKPVPMDDIVVPDPIEFANEAETKPSELGDEEYMNGHSEISGMSSQENLKENLHGNEKQDNGSEFGDELLVDGNLESQVLSDQLVPRELDYERVQKETTDFCDINVCYTNSPQTFDGAVDEELFERLKNKERDPMSMSFYQEKDEDTCELGISSNPFDLNAVQLLPNDDDEEISNELKDNKIFESDNLNFSNNFIRSNESVDVTSSEINAAIKDLDNAVHHEVDFLERSQDLIPSEELTVPGVIVDKAPSPIDDQSPFSDNVSQLTEPSEVELPDVKDVEICSPNRDSSPIETAISQDSALSKDMFSPPVSPYKNEVDLCHVSNSPEPGEPTSNTIYISNDADLPGQFLDKGHCNLFVDVLKSEHILKDDVLDRPIEHEDTSKYENFEQENIPQCEYTGSRRSPSVHEDSPDIKNVPEQNQEAQYKETGEHGDLQEYEVVPDLGRFSDQKSIIKEDNIPEHSALLDFEDVAIKNNLLDSVHIVEETLHPTEECHNPPTELTFADVEGAEEVTLGNVVPESFDIKFEQSYETHFPSDNNQFIESDLVTGKSPAHSLETNEFGYNILSEVDIKAEDNQSTEERKNIQEVAVSGILNNFEQICLSEDSNKQMEVNESVAQEICEPVAHEISEQMVEVSQSKHADLENSKFVDDKVNMDANEVLIPEFEFDPYEHNKGLKPGDRGYICICPPCPSFDRPETMAANVPHTGTPPSTPSVDVSQLLLSSASPISEITQAIETFNLTSENEIRAVENETKLDLTSSPSTAVEMLPVDSLTVEKDEQSFLTDVQISTSPIKTEIDNANQYGVLPDAPLDLDIQSGGIANAPSSDQSVVESEDIIKANHVDSVAAAVALGVAGIGAAVSVASSDRKTPVKPKAAVSASAKKTPLSGTKSAASAAKAPAAKSATPKTSMATQAGITSAGKKAVPSPVPKAPTASPKPLPKAAPAPPKPIVKLSTVAAAAKPKLTATSAKPSVEKKLSTNEEVKAPLKKPAASVPKVAALKVATSKTVPSVTAAPKTAVHKTTLSAPNVKPVPASRVSSGTTATKAPAAAAPKPKPTVPSISSSKPASLRPTSGVTTARVGPTRSSVAPASDKLAKETTNRQISAKPAPARPASAKVTESKPIATSKSSTRTSLTSKNTISNTIKKTTSSLAAPKSKPITKLTSSKPTAIKSPRSLQNGPTEITVKTEEILQIGQTEISVNGTALIADADVYVKDNSPQQADNSLLPVLDVAAD